MEIILRLVDGRLYNDKAEELFPDADYFYSADDAVRWLSENTTGESYLVVEAEAV